MCQRLASAALVFACLFSASPLHAQEPHPLRWPALTLLVGESLDEATTEWDIHQRTGLAEANPLFPTTGARIVGKVAITSLVLWGMHYEARHGHPTVAKWLGYSVGGYSAALAWSNATIK